MLQFLHHLKTYGIVPPGSIEGNLSDAGFYLRVFNGFVYHGGHLLSKKISRAKGIGLPLYRGAEIFNSILWHPPKPGDLSRLFNLEVTDFCCNFLILG
jgi:hypothetical protein